MYGLQRDLRHAGYGITDIGLLGCNITLRPGVVLNGISPVTINHASITGHDANTDTLLIVYGHSESPPEGDVIISHAANTTYTVAAGASFRVNDRLLALGTVPPSPCAMPMLTVQNPPAGSNITVTPLGGGSLPAAMNSPSLVNGAAFNLGQAPRVLAYAVRGGELTVCDYMVVDCSSNVAANWNAVASNIVSMRAQYGRDVNPLDTFVDTYDQAALTSACLRARVLALRLVIVARSAQFDKTVVTSAAPTWAGTATHPINLSANAEWGNYRYRTFETVVPLRNLVWRGATC